MTTAPPGALDAPHPTERQPVYRDRQLRTLIKELRAAVRFHPPAKLALEQVERRLRYILRVLETWDGTHAQRAEQLIALGNLPAANSASWLIFDQELRCNLLARCQIGGDDGAAERLAEAARLGREVL